MEHTVLVFAPHGRDAALTAQVLAGAKIGAAVCSDAKELIVRIEEGVGTVLLTEEALAGPQTLDQLDAAMAAQLPWSSLPVVVLRSERRGGRAPNRPDRLTQRLGGHQGVIFLQRSVPVASLTSILRSTLAARERQYQLRDFVGELAMLNANLEVHLADRTAVATHRAEQLRELSGELLLTEEREQRRFAEILHDDVQQLLMAATMNAHVLLRARNDKQKEKMGHALLDLLQRAGKVTRTLTVELNAPILYERGLAAALGWLATEMGEQHRVEMTVSARSVDDPSSADLRVFFFRATRELMLNAVKYGGGSAIHVTMERDEEGTLRIAVADEGPGFDPASLGTRDFGVGGFGLANIRQRAALLGGELCIDSAPGRGTRMTLVAPVPPTG